MKEINIYQVDAFTEKPFGGNPAGVVLDGESLTEKDMQNIANEMNLSETAFVTHKDEDNFTVRFFTPTCEVDLCGHATIATFYTLCKLGYIKPLDEGVKVVYQETKAGRLGVELIFANGEINSVLMEQTTPEGLGVIKDVEELCKSMGINEEDIKVENKPVYPEVISTGLPDIILPVRSKEVLDNLEVDMRSLAKLSKDLEVTGVHAFYLPDKNSDIVYTRNFAPLVGIDEEAATGTANGALIYFLKKNKLTNNNYIKSHQGESMNRPSIIHCSIEEEGGDYIVKVGGKAIIVLKGKILLN